MSDSVMLSVIVPVYNVDRKFLGECLESILGQTFTDFELIVIDDGASDDLAKYLDGYDYRSVRHTVIHQENAGVASARNRGIKEAAGTYITFVDSDDTIEKDCFLGITEYANGNFLDVLMWGIRRDYGAKSDEFSPYLCDIPRFTDAQKEEVRLKCLVGILPFYVTPPASADAAGSACAKLYRRQFLADHGLLYIPGLKRAEDMEFNLRVFDAADSVGYLYRFYYNYRQLDTSATYTYRPGGIEVFTASLNAIREHLEKAGKSDLYFQVYYMRCMFFYLESMDMDYLNPNNPKKLSARIRELARKSYEEPYATAFSNLSGEYLTFARKIPLFLIRHRMFRLLALFYKGYKTVSK